MSHRARIEKIEQNAVRLPRLVKNIADMRFGRLIALSYVRSQGTSGAVWLCRCDCGVEKEILGSTLRAGLIVSCGCYNREASRARAKAMAKHGHTANGKASPEFQSWSHMIQRCTNPAVENYRYYGARGIRVCDRWLNSFEAFLEDMGPRPSMRHTIDRTNSDGNYEPFNCRWATREEQARNTRSNRLLSFRGETKTLAEWAEITGIKRLTITQRLKRGWVVDEALTIPLVSPAGRQLGRAALPRLSEKQEAVLAQIERKIFGEDR